jgi:hypothetical protein
MPRGLVKTKQDEQDWATAKRRASEAGHSKNWAYVTRIYMRIKKGRRK